MSELSESEYKDVIKNLNNDYEILTAFDEFFDSTHEAIFNVIKCLDNIVLPKEVIKLIVFSNLKKFLQDMLLRTVYYEYKLQLKNKKHKNTSTNFDSFLCRLRLKHSKKNFFNKYPFLLQNIERYLTNFIQAMCKLLTRLNKDSKELNRMFFHGENLIVCAIKFLGDNHCFGEAVALISVNIKSETRNVIYKPRNLGIDEAYGKFINWFNQISTIKLKTAMYITNEDYGWSEYITYKVCQTMADIDNFYLRLGAIACLMYILCGTDMHSENIIAHGEHPIIVDHECLLVPLYQNKNADIRNLVIFSMIFPRKRMVSSSKKGIDNCALLGVDKENHPYKKYKLAVENNKIYLNLQNFDATCSLSIPTHNRKLIDPIKHIDKLVYGFEITYKLLLKQKYFLLSDQSALNLFKDKETRLVFRNTSTYHKIIYDLFHPANLKTFNDIDNNYFKQCLNGNKKIPDDIKANEIIALKNLDVPQYSVATTDCHISDCYKHQVHSKLSVSGLNRVKENLANNLNTNDMLKQINLIYQSIHAFQLNANLTKYGNLKNGDINYSQLTNNIDEVKEISLQLGMKISKKIENLCFINKHEIFWTTISSTKNNVYMPIKTNYNFFSGASGIFLVLNEAHLYEKNSHLVDLITVYCQYLFTKKKMLNLHASKQNGYFGIAGMILSFLKIFENNSINIVKDTIEYLLQLYTNNLFVNYKEKSLSGYAQDLLLLTKCSKSIFDQQLSILKEKLAFYLYESICNIFKNSATNFSSKDTIMLAYVLIQANYVDADILLSLNLENNINIEYLIHHSTNFQFDVFLLKIMQYLKNENIREIAEKIINKNINMISLSEKLNIQNGLFTLVDLYNFLYENYLSLNENVFKAIETKIIDGVNKIEKLNEINKLHITAPGLINGFAGVAYQLFRLHNKHMHYSLLY